MNEGETKMAQIIKSERVILSGKETQAFELIVSVLDSILRETECPELDRISNDAITEINNFLEYVDFS